MADDCAIDCRLFNRLSIRHVSRGCKKTRPQHKAAFQLSSAAWRTLVAEARHTNDELACFPEAELSCSKQAQVLVKRHPRFPGLSLLWD